MSTRIPAARDDAPARSRSARRPWLRKRLLIPLAAAALLIPAGTALACVTPGGVPWTPPPGNAAPPQLPPQVTPPQVTPPEHKPPKHKPSCREHHKKCKPSTPGTTPTPSTPVTTPTTPVTTPATPPPAKGGSGCLDTTNPSCKVVTGNPSFTG